MKAYVTGLTNTIDLKANKASPTFTGTVTIPNLTLTGDVGIGTTSPYSKLEITAGADKSHIRISEGNHNEQQHNYIQH